MPSKCMQSRNWISVAVVSAWRKRPSNQRDSREVTSVVSLKPETVVFE